MSPLTVAFVALIWQTHTDEITLNELWIRSNCPSRRQSDGVGSAELV